MSSLHQRIPPKILKIPLYVVVACSNHVFGALEAKFKLSDKFWGWQKLNRASGQIFIKVALKSIWRITIFIFFRQGSTYHIVSIKNNNERMIETIDSEYVAYW